MDIGGWLRSLGLEEYETAFRENKVDAAVLPKLTAEDLKDLGVAAIGDRRKLLEAIADLQLGAQPEPTPLAASRGFSFWGRATIGAGSRTATNAICSPMDRPSRPSDNSPRHRGRGDQVGDRNARQRLRRRGDCGLG